MTKWKYRVIYTESEYRRHFYPHQTKITMHDVRRIEEEFGIKIYSFFDSIDPHDWQPVMYGVKKNEWATPTLRTRLIRVDG